MEGYALLPNAAIRYGIKELARRAGVSKEFFDSWRIESDASDAVVRVFVDPERRKQIRFPKPDGEYWSELKAGRHRTATARWLNPQNDGRGLVPDFKVPFSSSRQSDIGPLFVRIDEHSVECRVDLLTSAILTLARFEETFPGPRDNHGRFAASSSIAWREGFLHRPIVDEYGLALAEALSWLLPSWEPFKTQMQVNLGHDVDEIGLPFSLRNSVAHALRRGSLMSTTRDFMARVSNLETAYERLLRELVKVELEKGFFPATYWKASSAGPHDTGYDPKCDRIQKLMSAFRRAGLELGIHLSYDSFDSLDMFRSEVSTLQSLLGEARIGGRQDYLRWSPQTWVRWNSMDLAYDASVGFADHVGFRAGTSYPYHPWLLSESREANLLEIPLILMDTALFDYMKLQPSQALRTVSDCVARCKIGGGVFTMVWHNTTMMHPERARSYREMLDSLRGLPTFDWRKSSDGRHWN